MLNFSGVRAARNRISVWFDERRVSDSRFYFSGIRYIGVKIFPVLDVQDDSSCRADGSILENFCWEMKNIEIAGWSRTTVVAGVC